MRQLRLLGQSRLHDDVDRFVVEPVGMDALQGAPGQPAKSVDLLALHGERDVVGSRIAGDQLGLGAEHVLVQMREHVRIGAGALAAERGRLGQKVVPGLDRGFGRGDAQAGVPGDAAQPGEFRCVECSARDREQRRDRYGAAESADGGAVLDRDPVDIVGRLDAAGARHVLRHHIGPARNMLAQIARQEPPIGVIAAADAVADDDRDAAALVEVLDAGGVRGKGIAAPNRWRRRAEQALEIDQVRT